MPRPIQAIIHHDALRHNLAVVRKTVPNSQVFAVVKANAYGHGIERVYPALNDADGFALLDIDEAKRLRGLGWQGPIILLEGIFSAQDVYDCATYNLSFSIHHQAQITWLQHYPYPAQFDVYLKMNTGMNRLGFPPEQYRTAWQQLNAAVQIRSITHMMHFSDADNDRFGKNGIDEQLELFNRSIQDLPGKRTLSNSAAILRHHQQITAEHVRAGIVLYGSSPDYPIHTIADWDLQPSMSLRSEIIAIQDLVAQQTIGYGSLFCADKNMRIGIVACGYADGYQRITATGTPVLVNGIRSQILGRVSMDMLAVDLTNISTAEVGSEVVLWGKSSCNQTLAIDEVAAGSGTVGYELMCGITNRVNFKIEA